MPAQLLYSRRKSISWIPPAVLVLRITNSTDTPPPPMNLDDRCRVSHLQDKETTPGKHRAAYGVGGMGYPLSPLLEPPPPPLPMVLFFPQTIPVELSTARRGPEDRPHDGDLCHPLLPLQPRCLPIHRCQCGRGPCQTQICLLRHLGLSTPSGLSQAPRPWEPRSPHEPSLSSNSVPGPLLGACQAELPQGMILGREGRK